MQEIKLKITIDGKEALATLDLTENNIKGLVSAFQNAQNNVVNFSAKVTDSLTKIRNVIQGVKESFDVLRQTFGASIDNYLAQEQALTKLTTALQQSKKYTDANLQSLIDYSSRLQEITVYGDDAYQTIMAQMLAMGLSVEQTKEAALQAANLAAIMGTDLHTAARVMADVFNGNAELLKRYVKGIDESAIKSGDFNKILQELNRSIGNQAEALSQTAAGSIAKFKNSLGDLLENTGKLLSDALTPLLLALSNIFQALNKLPPEITGIAGLIANLTAAYITLRTTGILPAISSITLFMEAVSKSQVVLAKSGFGAAILAISYGLYELSKAYNAYADAKRNAEQVSDVYLQQITQEAAKASKEELIWSVKYAEERIQEIKTTIVKLEEQYRSSKKRIEKTDREGNLLGEEYIETEKSKQIAKEIEKQKAILETTEKQLNIYQNYLEEKNKVSEKKSEEELKQEFETKRKILLETQRHKFEILKLETDSDLILLEERKKHLDEQIELYKKYNQDTIELENRRIETIKAIEKEKESLKAPKVEIEDTQDLEYDFEVKYGKELEYARLTKQQELELWYQTELEKIKQYENFQSMKLALDQEYNLRLKELRDEEINYYLEGYSRIFAGAKAFFNKQTAVYKALAIAQILMDTYKAATAALAPPPSGLGPLFGIPLAAVVTATGLANAAKVANIKIPGFAEGGKLPAGRVGFIEGYKTEIIAPEKTFVEVFRQELKPQIYNNISTDQSIAKELKNAIGELNKTLSNGIYGIAYLNNRQAEQIFVNGQAINKKYSMI